MARRPSSFASTAARLSPLPLPSTVGAPPMAANGQLALFEGSGEALPPPAPRLRPLVPFPDLPVQRVSRLSYTALSLFERCAYRYYAERVAGMRPAAWAPAERVRAALHATELGDAVHRLLERVDLARPVARATSTPRTSPGTRP